MSKLQELLSTGDEPILIKYKEVFYYVSYVDEDDQSMLVAQTDLIGEGEELERISFADLDADADLKLYVAKLI